MTSALSVVFVTHSAQLSGAELAVMRVAINSRTIMPIVMVFEDGPLIDELRRHDVESIVLDPHYKRRGSSRQHRLSRASGLLRQLRHVGRCYWRGKRTLAGVSPDVVVTNSWISHGVLIAIRVFSKRRWALIAHVRELIDGGQRGAIVRSVYGRAIGRVPDAVIGNSKTTIESVPTLSRRQVRAAIPSPIELASAVSRASSERDEIVYGVLGRVSPWKGQELAIRAFSSLFAGKPNRFLEFVGAPLFGEDEYLERCERLCVKLGVADQVRWLGHRRDIYHEILRWRALIHSSLEPEPFGQVIVQAMSAGVPVIASGEGGPAETIRDGVTGLLYRPRSQSALAACIERMDSSAELRRSLAANALSEADRYAAINISGEYEDFLRVVLARGGTERSR